MSVELSPSLDSMTTGGRRGPLGALRSFIVCAGLSYRALFNWATPGMYVGSVLMPPLFQLFFFVLLGRTLNAASDQYFVIGNVVLACSISGIFGGTMAMANERNFGTLSYLLLSSQSRIMTLASRGLPFVINGMIASTFVVLCVTPLLKLDWSGSAVLGLVLAVMVASVSSTGLGLCLGAIGLRLTDIWLAGNLMVTAMILVTGVNVPTEDLPAGMAVFGQVIPVTHAVTAARAAFAGDLWAAGGALLVELGIAAAYLLLAYILILFFERSTRVSAKSDVL